MSGSVADTEDTAVDKTDLCPLGAHMLVVWRVKDGFQSVDLAAWRCLYQTEETQGANLN